MVEISNLRSPQLVEAVQLWTGWGHSMMPNRDDKRVVDRFGEQVGVKLLSLIKSLEADFYASDAQFVAADIQEMGKVASRHFKLKHPIVAEEIVEAFAWCYTFDYK